MGLFLLFLVGQLARRLVDLDPEAGQRCS